MSRTIAVFTGTRAEYGLLKPVMQRIGREESCALQTIVGGTHLRTEFGKTIEEIHRDGLPVHYIIETRPVGGLPVDVCAAMGDGLARCAEILDALKPDLLVLLGDRFETFSMAAAAMVCRVPIAHIHGGETTGGLIDDAFRHSITKMSHLHFTSCEEYRRRVIQLGEDPERVFTVGSPGVENSKNTELLDGAAIRKELTLAPDMPYLLCTMHPITLDPQPPAAQIAGLCEALDRLPTEYAIIFTGANADPGGAKINEALQAFVNARPQCRFFMSLGQKRYFSAVKHAACVLGNSSSGIIEVPSFCVPVVDIGDRQKGRIRASSVLHCEVSAEAVVAALRKALRPEHRETMEQTANPYDKAGTAAVIVDTLAKHVGRIALQKTFCDLPQRNF